MSEEETSDTPSLVGTTIADRYRVDALLGEGGMGQVFRGEHIHLRKPVAIKVLHREMTALEEAVKRFEREAVASATIKHPHVVNAMDFGKLPDGSFYLVLEFVAGETLTKTISRGPMPHGQALRVALQIAEALSASHEADIVHRDLKPENVMLIEHRGQNNFVKVLDFGIAKLTGGAADNTQLTQLGTVIGTPTYIAPEQASGKNIDHRVDLYAFGIMFYEMLTGAPPFEADEILIILTKQLTEAPPPLPETIDSRIRDLVFELLEKKPDKRPVDANAVSHRLADILESYPVVEGDYDPVQSGPRSRSHSVVDFQVPSTPKPPSDNIATAQTETNLVSPTLDSRRMPRDVPTVKIAAGVALAALVSFFGVFIFGDGEPDDPAALVAEDGDPTEEWLEPAAQGETRALAKLAAVKPKERSSSVWLALGRGYTEVGDYSQAVIAYDRALDERKNLKEDPETQRDLRNAAASGKALPSALELIADKLESAGADILFDVWAGTHKKTTSTKLARKLLDSPEVQKKSSPALKIALQLRVKGKCEEMKALLPEATNVADSRSVRPLKKLTRRSGCGFIGLGDCWGCLRKKGGELKAALAAAEGREAPTFSSTPAPSSSTE